jgi:hypothetical protein
MASVYPGALDTLSTSKSDATTTATDHAAHHNDLADAVNKIEAELGVNPSGASATVAALLSTGVMGSTAPDYTVSGHSTLRTLVAPTWTTTNVTSDRTFNANSYTFDELADALGTLIADYDALRNLVMTMAADLITRGVYT